MEPIAITNYKGVYTNANTQTTPKEYLAVLKNMRILPGKLVKTFGIGAPANIGSAVATPPASTTWYNLYTYINDRLTGDGLTGRVYILVGITATTNVLHVYALDEEGDDTWRTIDSLDSFIFSGSYYHTAAHNPILCDNEVLRLYPGITNRGAGITYNGVWIGYIDREYFDGLYDPTAAFYDAKTDIDKPVITSSGIGLEVEQIDAGQGYGYNPYPDYPGEIKYYKFSYIYDGIQESLLSEVKGINFGQDKIATIYFDIETATFNKRITGINVYRSDNENSDYKKIQKIDFLRTADATAVGVYARTSFGANGCLYIPELSSYNFNSGYDYKITVTYNSVDYDRVYTQYVDATNTAQNLDGDGADVFYGLVAGLQVLPTAGWNQAWKLEENDGGGYDIVATNSTGAFWGEYVSIILDYTGTGVSDMIGGAVYSEFVNRYYIHKIVDNYKKAFLFDKTFIYSGSTTADAATYYKVIKPTSGYYFPRQKRGFIYRVNTYAAGAKIKLFCLYPHHLSVNDTIIQTTTVSGYNNSGNAVTVSEIISDYVYVVDIAYSATATGIWTDSDVIQYLFFDTGQEGTDPYPISEATPSILVHSEFATVINNRGWYAGRIILDPGGANELQRNDAIAYSENGQIDVVPSQNLIRLVEREGGICTGLAVSFGQPVFLKKQGILKIDTKTNPDNPLAWKPIESIHNIGNVAKEGYFNWGDVLGVWYHDGGYLLSPNNLSASDSTPTEKLKFTDAIEDLYLSMTDAQRAGIKTEIDPVRSEVLCIFPFSTPQIWAYHLVTGSWRQILSGVTVNLLAKDENNQILVYQTSDKKLYSFGASESVAIAVKTLPVRMSFDRATVLKRIIVNYKSASDVLTMKVYYEEDIPSGNIQPGVTYYNNGYTNVSYIGDTTIASGETFVGLQGHKTYTTEGAGTVLLYDSYTLPVHSTMREEYNTPEVDAEIATIEITSSASTNSIEIGEIIIIPE